MFTKRVVRFLALVLLFGLQLPAQEQTSKLKIHAVLVDRDLNLKPVPRLTVVLRPQSGEPVTVKTSLDGIIEVEFAQGLYHLTTAKPVEFQGKSYSWGLDVFLNQPQQTVVLSNDNAAVALLAGAAAPTAEGTTALFQRLRNSVVRVRAEGADGSGFFVDPAGLILTNNHVVEKSNYLAVQFDERRKAEARLLAADSTKDIAVLWVNPSAFPEAVIAPLAQTQPGESGVREGEELLAITSPLYGEKLLTRGIVSRIESDVIISDIHISPGSSGGPVFDPRGTVVGIATARGAGVSWLIRIQEVLPLLEEGRKQLVGQSAPESTWLPVTPTDFFPPEPLRAVLRVEKFDTKKYFFSAGPFEVMVATPVLRYYLKYKNRLKAARRRAKRAKRPIADAELPTGALEDAQKFKPLIIIRALPKMSRWRVNKHKADFHKMRLLCNGEEVQPIDPGRYSHSVYDGNRSLLDRAYQGVYTYMPDAISTTCGNLVLEVFSEKEPNQPSTLILDQLLVSHIWGDFEPYRKALAAKTP